MKRSSVVVKFMPGVILIVSSTRPFKYKVKVFPSLTNTALNQVPALTPPFEDSRYVLEDPANALRRFSLARLV